PISPLAPAGALLQDLGPFDLFGTRGLIWPAFTADTAPCLQGELQPAVVTVAGVDMPISARFALGDFVPDGVTGFIAEVGGRVIVIGVISVIGVRLFFLGAPVHHLALRRSKRQNARAHVRTPVPCRSRM